MGEKKLSKSLCSLLLPSHTSLLWLQPTRWYGSLNSGSDHFIAQCLGQCLCVYCSLMGLTRPVFSTPGWVISPEGGHAQTVPKKWEGGPESSCCTSQQDSLWVGERQRKLWQGAELRQQLWQLHGAPCCLPRSPGPALTWVGQQYSVRPSSYTI